MALHQFDSEDSLADAGRAQRMTADEAQSVIALWQQERTEQTGLTDRPAVPDVAEGLGIAVEDVQRLLSEVRARRLEEERKLAREQMLAQAEQRITEDEARLAAIRQQREEMQQGKTPRPRHFSPRSSWVETKPGIWEDVNEQAPRVSLYLTVGLFVTFLIVSTALTLLVCLVWLLRSLSPQLTQ